MNREEWMRGSSWIGQFGGSFASLVLLRRLAGNLVDLGLLELEVRLFLALHPLGALAVQLLQRLRVNRTQLLTQLHYSRLQIPFLPKRQHYLRNGRRVEGVLPRTLFPQQECVLLAEGHVIEEDVERIVRFGQGLFQDHILYLNEQTGGKLPPAGAHWQGRLRTGLPRTAPEIQTGIRG